MSSNQFKCGFRVVIPQLRGKSEKEALQYFQPILGEPSYILEEDRYFYFEYDGKYQPRKEYAYDEYETADDGWCVNYILHEGEEGETDPSMYLSVAKITETVKLLTEKFGVSENDIIVFAYTYYNGTDEPILLQPRDYSDEEDL